MLDLPRDINALKSEGINKLISFRMKLKQRKFKNKTNTIIVPGTGIENFTNDVPLLTLSSFPALVSIHSVPFCTAARFALVLERVSPSSQRPH